MSNEKLEVGDVVEWGVKDGHPRMRGTVTSTSSVVRVGDCECTSPRDGFWHSLGINISLPCAQPDRLRKIGHRYPVEYKVMYPKRKA